MGIRMQCRERLGGCDREVNGGHVCGNWSVQGGLWFDATERVRLSGPLSVGEGMVRYG